MRKGGLKWSHAHKKGVLTKNDLKLRLKFAQKVCWKLPKNLGLDVKDFVRMEQVLHTK